MFSLSHLLAQAQQTQKLPWGFLVLFGLLAVAAVGLLIYFLTRVRKSEKEAEEDWGLAGRGILLSPATSIVPRPEKKPAVVPEMSHTPDNVEPPVPPAAEPVQPRLTSDSRVSVDAQPDSVATLEPIDVGAHVDVGAHELVKAPEVAKAAEIIPEPPELPIAELHHETVAQAEPELQHLDQGSPFDEEVWSQLESQQQAAVAGQPELRAPAATSPSNKEPYEPPRIAPIVPGKEPVQKAAAIAPNDEPVQKAPVVQKAPPAPEVDRPLSASQRYSAGPSRLEARPPLGKSVKPAAAV